MSSLKSFTTCTLVVLALAALAAAQGGATGAISGTVTDVTGAALAGAQVQIINQDTGAVARTLKTDASGAFTAPLLPVATYTVKITATGLGEGNFKDIAVRITETTRLTAKLAPLRVLEKVEVQATVQTIETTTATTGQAIEERTIRELPLATQNFQQLLTLSSGAQSELNASAQLGRGNARVIVNGQREDNNNYLIEGISATDYNVAQATYVPLPNPDVIQEFKVQTSLYDASQGRNGGGNVNAILKSGTRELHGDVYEFFRNDVLNANEFFLNRQGLARPSVKQNIFGGSVGGPVVKEKLGYFFVNYQGTRQRSGLSPGTFISTTIPNLPTDRSDASISQAFFGNATTAIDPVAGKLLNFKSNQFGGMSNGFLIPSGNPSTGAFAISNPGKYTDDQFTSNLGINRPTNNVTTSIYKFVFASSGFEIGPAPFADQMQTQNNHNFVDTLSWVKGKHVFRFGGEYTRVNLDKLFPQVFNGELFFTNTPTNGPLGAIPTTDFQNFLLGAPQFSFGGGGVFNHEYRANNFGFFAQDDWKIRSDLTLNLGLRTEVFGAFYDNLCHIGNLDPKLSNQGKFPFLYANCVKSLNVAGLTGNANNTTLDNSYTTGIGPRIGAAYDLCGKHNTTIRAGYGIYFVREDVGDVDQLSFQAPFLPVAFGGGSPGCLGSFFSRTPLPGCPNPNPNGLPQAGTIDPAFVGCLSLFQGFVVNGSNPPVPTSDTTQTPTYANPPGC